MQQRFLLQILLLAQHISGTTMPIIRRSRVLYSGCCLWYFVLWFSSRWPGVELRFMCPVCRMLVYWVCFVACTQLDATEVFLLQILWLVQHVSGTTMPIIRSSRLLYSGCCLWYFVLCPVCRMLRLQTGHITLSSTPNQQLENHRTKYHRQQPLYNTIELLMMSIVVPETC